MAAAYYIFKIGAEKLTEKCNILKISYIGGRKGGSGDDSLPGSASDWQKLGAHV